MALNREEVAACFLAAFAITGATHTAFHSVVLREPRATQTTWLPLSGAAYHSRGPGARPEAQLTALVLRHPIRRAAQGKPAALHGSEGQCSNRLFKKKKNSSTVQINL